jgi:hypothetical protein
LSEQRSFLGYHIVKEMYIPPENKVRAEKPAIHNLVICLFRWSNDFVGNQTEFPSVLCLAADKIGGNFEKREKQK